MNLDKIKNINYFKEKMYVFIIFIFFELKNDNNVWLSSYIVYDEDEIDLKVKLWGNLAEEDEYKEN